MTVFDRLLLGGAILLGLLLLGPVLTIPLHIPINYNEGWNAGFDARAMHTAAGPLYPGPDAFVFNNYPPLGFYLLGAAGLVTGDMIMGGRMVALAALLGSAGLLGQCVHRLGGTVRSAVAAALLLLLTSATFYRSYVAMDDPQWLAHASMLGGLALLLRGDWATLANPARPPAWQVILAALLMTAGGFVKHNLVALPVATTLWLLWLDRRLALTWIAAAAASALAGAGLIAAMFGHVAFDDILHHARILQARRLTRAIGGLAPLIPVAIACGVLLRRRRLGNGAVLVGLSAALAGVTGIVQRMGDGVNYNAHFETLIALCLGFGLVVASLSSAPWPRAGRAIGPSALLVFAALPVLGAMPWHLPAAWHEVADRAARQAAWRPIIARLAASHGPVGCEMPSVCIWGGKPFSVDIFNLTQSILAGRSPEPFRRMVAGRGFAMFEYNPDSSTHRNAVRMLGRDPIIGPFAGLYGPVATGPGGAILLAPIPQPGATAVPALARATEP